MKTNSLLVGLSESVAAQAEARANLKKVSNVISLPQPSSPVLRVGRECRREDFLERIAFLALFASVAGLIVIALFLS